MSDKKEKKLTVTEAVNKYLFKPVDDELKTINNFANELSSYYEELQNSKKRKFAPLAILGELLLGGVFGLFGAQIYNILTNFVASNVPLLIFGGVTVASFALIEGVYQLIKYQFKTKELKNKLPKYKQFLNRVVTNQKLLKEVYWKVNDVVNANDLSKFTTNNLTSLIKEVYYLNKATIELIKNNYYDVIDEELRGRIDNFETTTIADKNMAEIIEVSNEILTIARSQLKGYSVENEYMDIHLGYEIYNSFERVNILMQKSILPFAQIINATYSRIKFNHDEEEERRLEQERILQEEIEERERKIQQAERKTIEDFFEEFDVDVPTD